MLLDPYITTIMNFANGYKFIYLIIIFILSFSFILFKRGEFKKIQFKHCNKIFAVYFFIFLFDLITTIRCFINFHDVLTVSPIEQNPLLVFLFNNLSWWAFPITLIFSGTLFLCLVYMSFWVPEWAVKKYEEKGIKKGKIYNLKRIRKVYTWVFIILWSLLIIFYANIPVYNYLTCSP